MHDPVRMVDEGDALEARVLGSARGDRAPDRVRERVLALGVAGAASAASAAAGATATTVHAAGAAGSLGVAKWALVMLVAGGAAAVTAKLVTQRTGESVPTRSAPVTALPAGTAPTVDRMPVTPPPSPWVTATPPLSASSSAPRARPPAPHAPRSELVEELALLDGARAALDSGDTDLAVRQLDRHDLDYVHGQLGPDALALRIDVYARRGDDAKVAELSRSFLARYPDHPQAPRVQVFIGTGGGRGARNP